MLCSQCVHIRYAYMQRCTFHWNKTTTKKTRYSLLPNRHLCDHISEPEKWMSEAHIACVCVILCSLCLPSLFFAFTSSLFFSCFFSSFHQVLVTSCSVLVTTFSQQQRNCIVYILISNRFCSIQAINWIMLLWTVMRYREKKLRTLCWTSFFSPA